MYGEVKFLIDDRQIYSAIVNIRSIYIILFSHLKLIGIIYNKHVLKIIEDGELIMIYNIVRNGDTINCTRIPIIDVLKLPKVSKSTIEFPNDAFKFSHYTFRLNMLNPTMYYYIIVKHSIHTNSKRSVHQEISFSDTYINTTLANGIYFVKQYVFLPGACVPSKGVLVKELIVNNPVVDTDKLYNFLINDD